MKKDSGPFNSLGFPKPTPNWALSESSPNISGGRANSLPSSQPILSAASSVPWRLENERRSTRDKLCGVNHLSYHELMDRKAKGLCFRCGKKFHPLYQCPNRSLHVMILGDDEMVDDSGDLLAIKANEPMGNESLECNVMGLFRVASLGLTDCRTIQISGSISGIP